MLPCKMQNDKSSFPSDSGYYQNNSAYEQGKKLNTKFYRGELHLSKFLDGLDTDLVINELKKMGKLQ